MGFKLRKNDDYDKINLIYEPNIQNKKNNNSSLLFILKFLSIFFLLSIGSLYYNYFFFVLLQNSCHVPKYDYLELSYNWLPAICTEKICNENSSVFHKWQIHGLWPDYLNNSWPQFCCNTNKFNIEELYPLKNDLNTNWNYLALKEKSLWKHEWLKHGTCCAQNSNLNSVFKYFNTTLNLFHKYKLQHWLESENILFNSNKTYKLDFLKKSLKIYYPKSVKIECISYRKQIMLHKIIASKKNYSFLKSISICLNDKDLQPIDCPFNKYQENCKQEVIYLKDFRDLKKL